MAKKFRAILIVLLLISLSGNVSGQGYMGTVSTGTGIIPALTIGKASFSPANMGAISSQANLTGSWAIELKGPVIRHFDLQMYQKDDLIFGTGQLSEDQSSLDVTAAGSVAGDRPTIFISLINGEQVFKLRISVSGEAIAGEYDFLSQTQSRQWGTVTGRMTLAAKTSPVKTLGKSVNPSASAGAWVGKVAQTQQISSTTGQD